MRLTVVFSAMASLLLAAAAEPAQQKPQDPQAAYEPGGAPGAGQKLLEKFVGEWAVAKTFFPRSGDPARSEGRCRQTMIHDGRFLQSEFVFVQNGRETKGTGIIGFEPQTGEFTSVWFDSRQTRMSLRRSRDPFDGNTIVLFSASLDPEAEKAKDARRSKTISRLEDGGRRLVHRQYALGPDGQERLMMELVMTKQPAAK